MDYTGERMHPEMSGISVFWEHIYRYRFAARFVRGRSVLDIACGEGYGSAALLRAGAMSVIGVDISPEACKHTTEKYCIEARVGDAHKIPLDSSSVDVVVSFETIEHVADPKMFISECIRVLRPNGLLVVSTPNRDAYRAFDPPNPFHCSELSDDEFCAIFENRFRTVTYYSQRPFSAAWWSMRGLTALNWPTRRLRGMRRLTAMWKQSFCRHLNNNNEAYYRERPIDAIRLKPGFLSSFVDPYAVRRKASKRAEFPIYIIAVAQR